MMTCESMKQLDTTANEAVFPKEASATRRSNHAKAQQQLKNNSATKIQKSFRTYLTKQEEK